MENANVSLCMLHFGLSFDYLGFDAESEALRTDGVPRGMTSWYTDLLKGRKVTANLQRLTQTRER